nr:MAG TPA: hypothetical protein [Caudoviricetes sp.]
MISIIISSISIVINIFVIYANYKMDKKLDLNFKKLKQQSESQI